MWFTISVGYFNLTSTKIWFFVFNSGHKLVSFSWGFIKHIGIKIIQSKSTIQKLDNRGIDDVYTECWFSSGVHGNFITTLNFWERRYICKICGIEINIEREQTQWFSLYLILTDTFGVDSCGTICTLDVINKLSVTNTADVRTGVKEYSNGIKWWLMTD